jgi:hypothetical protein
MGAAYVIAENQEGLITAYERYAGESIEIFPNQVAQKWHKWLRAKPDFQRDKKNDEIKKLIVDNSEVAGQWITFKGFLQQFVQANPSVSEEWSKVIKGISQWLS